MLAFFKSKGKTLIGWDEIIEGKIDSSAVVMFWRTWAPEAPANAAKNGNKVVMTPDGPFYFDAIEDAQSLSAVYNYDLFGTGKHRLNDNAKKSILGLQANLWTEHIPSEKRADYMIMPRLTALAENAWTHKNNYKEYLQRLNAQYDRLDQLNIHYRLPDISNLVGNYAIMGKTTFFAPSPSPRFKIHYTTDGSEPLASSPVMEKPVTLEHAAVMKLALFTPAGRRGEVYKLNFNEQQLSQSKSIPNLKKGLTAKLYKGSFEFTTNIKGTPDSVFVIDGIKVPASINAPTFALQFSGYIDVPETGIYTFYLMCNDGGILKIGDQKIIDNDGPHPDKTVGGQAGLQKGLHPLALDFSEYGGGYSLELKYSFKGSEPKAVPAEWFKTE
jgi:hexosaminidase